MLNLSSTMKITASLGGAVTTNNVIATASFVDWSAANVPTLEASIIAELSATANADVVPSPSSGVRKVQLLNFQNADTVVAVLNVQLYSSGTHYLLDSFTLQPGEALQYVDGRGFFFAVSAEMRLIEGGGAIKGPAGKAWQLDVGATADRPAGADGMLRYNSDTPGFEGYSNSAWGAIGGSGGGDSNLDGGFSSSTYTAAQLVDGEGA